jgi:large subunit ribosomal protein L23
MQAQHILKRPIVMTEKATRLKATENKVSFEVSREATKHQIRAAVEQSFNVKVLAVNTLIVRGRMRRMGRGYAKTNNWKKAVVTLRKGDVIAALELDPNATLTADPAATGG